MTFDIALTLLVVAGAVVALAATRLAPDVVLTGALAGLTILGVLPIDDALYGFANKGLATVAVLYVIAEGLRQTGAIGFVGRKVLGQPKSLMGAQARVMFPAAFMSAFLNNTPVVAILLPVLNDWARKMRLSVSHLMLPLSYAAILGGLCTRIGTSTTIVVDDLVVKSGGRGLSLFEIGLLGLPIALVGLTYLLLTTRWLLPVRKPGFEQFEDPREYTVEMIVPPDSPLIGLSIEQAGLRQLPGMYLLEIDREGAVIAAVGPDERLRGDDRLVFVGVVESVVDLQRTSGLKPATDQVFKLDSPRTERSLVEVVVSNSCPIVNQTIREARFRSRYNAAVIAVGRNGERLRGKIGDIRLLPGDTLLLEAHSSFATVQRNSRDFLLVSAVDDSTPVRHERAWVAQGLLAGMVALVLFFDWDMLNAALLAAGCMLATRCVRTIEARRAIDWPILVTMAAGIGLGQAMEISGAASYVANGLVQFGGAQPLPNLAILYAITMVFTNLITAKAAAVLILPVALQTAENLGVSLMPFAVAIMVSAAASFATPIGYQTNLMIYGPGGYRYSDFLRIGIPLSVLIWGLSVGLIPVIWPFDGSSM